jgi:hypothetical protein
MMALDSDQLDRRLSVFLVPVLPQTEDQHMLPTATENQNDSPMAGGERVGIAAILGFDLPTTPERPARWMDDGPLPRFEGHSFEHYVTEWRLVDREAQDRTWRLAAIAASLERSSGGRLRAERKRTQTAIQKFCEAVKVDRQTFHRLSRTYSTISSLAGEAGVSGLALDLSFKHYEVAVRLAGDEALDAIARARQHRWSANALQRVLDQQRDKPQKQQRRVSFVKAEERIRKMMEGWQEHDRRMFVPWLRRLADEVEQEVGPAPPVTTVLDFIDQQLQAEVDSREAVSADEHPPQPEATAEDDVPF